ncbi:MAG TPA: hypothetical protein VMB50_14460 [Myxococcales bacterium]|nr:hypothetical protein [Myxococcales bacterium]
MSLAWLLRAAGASLVALSFLHAALWRALHWGPESERLSPLNARVFAAHTFFVAFVLLGLGLLSFARPDLLLARSDLARLLLWGVVAFWLARLALQALVFDSALRTGRTRPLLVRLGFGLPWVGYAALYGAALLRQYGRG